MAKPKMKRWVCPRCGSGALAPSKPRKDDVRRYCLKCSASTGRLVERTCPSVEAARESASERRRIAAAKRREREAARELERWTAAGIEVREEMRRLCSMPCVQPELQRRGLGKQGRLVLIPSLTIARTSKPYVTGTAWWQDIHLSIPRETTPAEVKSLLAHELAHIATPREEGHGEVWRRCYVLLASQAYGIDVNAAAAMGGSMHQLDERVKVLLIQSEGKRVAHRQIGKNTSIVVEAA